VVRPAARRHCQGAVVIAWLVYLGNRWLTTVYYADDCDAEWVRRGLINHDGYPPAITVYRRAS